MKRTVYFFDKTDKDVEDVSYVAHSETPYAEDNEMFEHTFEQAAVGMAHVGLSGEWIRVNQKLCDIVGFSREELLEKTFQEISYAPDLPRDLIQTQRLLKGEIDHYTLEKRYIRKNGSLVWIQPTAAVVRDRQKKPEYFIAVIEDIAARKQLEEKHAQLAAIVSSSYDAIYSKSMDGILQSWNKTAIQLYGYKPEEIIGKPVLTIIPPEKHGEYYAIMDSLAKGKKIPSHETIRLKKNGERISVSLTVSPIYDSAGNIIGASAIARDISMVKKMEQQQEFLLEASKALATTIKYQENIKRIAQLAIAYVADWCAIVIKEDGKEIVSELAHKDEKKRKWAEKLQKKLKFTINPKNGSVHVMKTGVAELYTHVTDDMLEKVVENEKDLRLLKKIGFTSAIVVPILKSGKAIGTISLVSAESKHRFGKEDLAMVEDVSSRISLAIENSQLYIDMQQAIVARENFISLASHELKTPLTSMSLYLHYLEKALPSNKKTSTILPKVYDQVTEMNELVSDLLDVSRIQHGSLFINKAQFDIFQLVKETIEDISFSAPGYTFKVIGKENIQVVADKTKIKQVMINFLANAIKYSPKGKKIVVFIKKSSYVTVQVKDYGIGIEGEHQPHIFEKFYRIYQSQFPSKTFPGLGIGLYISSEIIKAHGGTIWVKSKPGKGSTFSFTLPL